MRTSLIIYFTYLLSLTAICQSNYEEGYIIKMNGDTLSGRIKYNWASNAEKVSLLQNEKSETYTIDEVSEIRITGGDWYRKKEFDLDISPVKGNQLLRVSEKSISERRIGFLRLIISGPIIAYQYYDGKQGRYHYYIKTSDADEPTELIKQKRIVQNNNQPSGQSIKTIEKYKSQLTYLTRDCKLSESIADMIDLNEKYLKRIITQYNCLLYTSPSPRD